MSVALTEGLRLRAGRYELERRLGSGAAAAVWRARDTLLGRPVAVKVLAEGLAADDAWLARFRREGRIAARLQHPNLVPVYDFEADAERPYLVMAYMPGGSLQDRLDAGAQPDAERLAVDLLGALSHIHAAGIVHRDVKPANVLLDRDGRACLTDFGVARPEDATSITQTGQVPGTARYMAPELWRGEPASDRSDLFACGVLLSQALGDESRARLIGLVERMGAENLELRPASAAAALEMLKASDGTAEPTTATAALEPPAAPDPAPVRVPGPRRWPAVAALCAVALVAGIALANAIGGDEEPSAPEQRAQDTREPQGSGGDGAASEAGTGQAQPAPPPIDPVALNDQGYALIQQGRYDQAIPLLQQAVAALEGSGDITYAYALYNLGHALRLAGRPEEAIPILEERLQIPNQTDVVAAELEAARRDAGIDSDDGKAPKAKKAKDQE